MVLLQSFKDMGSDAAVASTRVMHSGYCSHRTHTVENTSLKLMNPGGQSKAFISSHEYQNMVKTVRSRTYLSRIFTLNTFILLRKKFIFTLNIYFHVKYLYYKLCVFLAQSCLGLRDTSSHIHYCNISL